MTIVFDPDSLAEAAPDRMAALARLLVARGVADERMVERARAIAAETGRRLDAVLTQLGLVSDRTLAALMAELLGLAVAAPERYPAAPLFAERLRPAFLRRARLVPVAADAETVTVASADPFDDFAPAAVAEATGLAVRLEVAVPAELEAALDRLYPPDGAGEADTESGDGLATEEDAERLKDLASEAPVIRLVNQIVARAVENGASDIHIQPFPDRVRVRYRYDGILHEEEAPPAQLAAAIISRIKIMARLDVAERRLPQDGRLKLAVRGQDVDFRVSTVPSVHGETVVLRILDRSTVTFDFARLGLPTNLTRRLRHLLDLPNGMVLVTGPTGSGKTTTLYTGLAGLDSVSRNIVTIEDPVEYQLGGINQIQVKSGIGLSFGTLLRAILRQDPDVIMVGEIRDLETAQTAVQAALTGHLLLSTLHTNTAAATVTRLRDMGLEPYLITAVLRGVLAQRLVRKVCQTCARPARAPADLAAQVGLDRFGRGPDTVLLHAVGCAQCRQTGYRGRIAVAELLVPEGEVTRHILAGAGHEAIERAAIEAGMVPLFDAGLVAALDGLTTVEEVMRTLKTEI